MWENMLEPKPLIHWNQPFNCLWKCAFLNHSVSYLHRETWNFDTAKTLRNSMWNCALKPLQWTNKHLAFLNKTSLKCYVFFFFFYFCVPYIAEWNYWEKFYWFTVHRITQMWWIYTDHVLAFITCRHFDLSQQEKSQVSLTTSVF